MQGHVLKRDTPILLSKYLTEQGEYEPQPGVEKRRVVIKER